MNFMDIMSALVYSSPFLFAGGLNKKALIAFMFLFISALFMHNIIDKRNPIIELLFAITLSVLASILVSIYFGFFTFAFCLSCIASEAIINPHEASYVARKYSIIATIISCGFMCLSYCIALYDFFSGLFAS